MCLQEMMRRYRRRSAKKAKAVKAIRASMDAALQALDPFVAPEDGADETGRSVSLLGLTSFAHGDGEEQELCEQLAGSYHDSKTDQTVEVTQDACNVTIRMGEAQHRGSIQGNTVIVAGFESTATIGLTGDVEWEDGEKWFWQLSEDDLRCEQSDAGGQQLTLTPDEGKFAQCPPGRYLGVQSLASYKERAARLRRALCVSKAHGKTVTNTRETNFFSKRGYMTYESSVWPKSEECVKLPAERAGKTEWINKIPYKVDTTASSSMGVQRLVSHAQKLEYRRIWKAASSTMPKYLRCEFTGKWIKARASAEEGAETFNGTYKVFSVVREPIDRWISGVGEIFERTINRYCISRMCDESDGFMPETPKKVQASTTWYPIMNESETKLPYGPRRLHMVIRAMIHDTSCNYRYYASEHLNTQSTFLAQNPGVAVPISHLIKLEDFDTGLEGLVRMAANASTPTGSCDVLPSNVAACKPSSGNVPTSKEIREALTSHPKFMRELCLVYAQDFVCFDYELPHACTDLF